jgi:hypothetical protein
MVLGAEKPSLNKLQIFAGAVPCAQINVKRAAAEFHRAQNRDVRSCYSRDSFILFPFRLVLPPPV